MVKTKPSPTNFQLPIRPFSISVYSSPPRVHMYTQAYACIHHTELMPSLHREEILGCYKLEWTTTSYVQ